MRQARRPVATDNPFLAAQEQVSNQITGALDAWREAVEKASEDAFHMIYGAPALQAALGIDPQSTRRPRRAAKSLLHDALVKARIAELKAMVAEGGLSAAVVRAMIYVGMARGRADERGFAAIRALRETHPAERQMTLADFKTLVRTQFFLLLIDEPAALAAIPSMLPEDVETRQAAWSILCDVLTASGELDPASSARLAQLETLFGLGAGPVTALSPGRARAKVKTGA